MARQHFLHSSFRIRFFGRTAARSSAPSGAPSGRRGQTAATGGATPPAPQDRISEYTIIKRTKMSRQHKAEKKLESVKRHLCAVIDELNALRRMGLGGTDESESGMYPRINLEDLRLPGRTRQDRGHIQGHGSTADRPLQEEFGTPYSTASRTEEWMVRMKSTPTGSTYQFCISLLDGAEKEPYSCL